MFIKKKKNLSTYLHIQLYSHRKQLKQVIKFIVRCYLRKWQNLRIKVLISS